jgi:hypothetical protein
LVQVKSSVDRPIMQASVLGNAALGLVPGLEKVAAAELWKGQGVCFFVARRFG